MHALRTVAVCLSKIFTKLVTQAVAVALYNPEMFKTLGAARLDLGQVLPDKMTDQCYKELLVRHSIACMNQHHLALRRV